MKFRTILVASISTILILIPCLALSAVGGSCVAGKHQVSIQFMTANEDAETGQGFILKREPIGFCGNPEFLFENPIPYTTEPGWYEYLTNCIATVTVDSPYENVAYKYTAYFVRADGTQALVPGLCAEADGHGFVGCGEAPIARGELHLTVYYGILAWTVDVCDSFCWYEQAQDWLTTEELFNVLVGELDQLEGAMVDVYGHRVYCPMAGDPYFEITKITPAPEGGCQAVPAEEHSFGGLKSLYR